MGRESSVAFMPTWSCSMSGGFWAPIENSPPEIQTMPDGAFSVGIVLLGMVGAKATVPDAIGIAVGAGMALGVGSGGAFTADLTDDGRTGAATAALVEEIFQMAAPAMAMTRSASSTR